MGALGLPQQICACLFDLDGGLTDIARVHGTARTELFDSDLKARAESENARFVGDWVGRADQLVARSADMVVTHLVDLMSRR